MDNPLLTKLKLPGRVFQLPSKGALYDGCLSDEITNGEVQIFPLSAINEINLKNPDLLFSGNALKTVLAECVPSVVDVTELFARDVDAIMLFLRIATYGNIYVVEVKHNCEHAKKHSYSVDLEQLVNEMKCINTTTIEKARFVKLSTGHVVKTRPMKFKNIIELFHENGNKKELSAEDLKEMALKNLIALIESVDDISDPVLIRELLMKITTPAMNKIINTANKINDWGPEQIVEIKCKDCGEMMKVELPTNPISFFTE